MNIINEHFTLEHLKDHLEAAIRVCDKNILINDNKKLYTKLKKIWVKQLEECKEEIKNNKEK